MESNTLKIMAQYLAQLHQLDHKSNYLKEYSEDELDTNGVEQDHVETFWPPDAQ